MGEQENGPAAAEPFSCGVSSKQFLRNCLGTTPGGVNDGARTRDIRLHKPALCQLSYAHQATAHHFHDVQRV